MANFHSCLLTCLLKNIQVDEFELEAVDLGDLTSLRIGHDGRGVGAGWYLNKIIVQEMTSDTNKQYVFHCNKSVLMLNPNNKMCGLIASYSCMIIQVYERILRC